MLSFLCNHTAFCITYLINHCQMFVFFMLKHFYSNDYYFVEKMNVYYSFNLFFLKYLNSQIKIIKNVSHQLVAPGIANIFIIVCYLNFVRISGDSWIICVSLKDRKYIEFLCCYLYKCTYILNIYTYIFNIN